MIDITMAYGTGRVRHPAAGHHLLRFLRHRGEHPGPAAAAPAHAGTLLLADANFACYELWRDAAAAGAELLWRAGAQLSLPAGAVLGDGTYLSRLKAPRRLRKQGAADITARVIEYHLLDAVGEVTETFALITTPP